MSLKHPSAYLPGGQPARTLLFWLAPCRAAKKQHYQEPAPLNLSSLSTYARQLLLLSEQECSDTKGICDVVNLCSELQPEIMQLRQEQPEFDERYKRLLLVAHEDSFFYLIMDERESAARRSN
jgi:hypothetical protein